MKARSPGILLMAFVLALCGLAPARAEHDVRFVSSDCGGEVASTCGADADDCGTCCEPDWSVSADALFLYRSDPSAVVLAFNTANPAEALDAAQLGFGVQAGYDLAVRRRLADGNSLEARFFAVDHWNTGATVATTPGDLLQIEAAVPIFTFSGDALAATYGSKLYNLELNGRRQVSDWLELLVGFRALELNERATLSVVNGKVPFDYGVATANRLYGGQVGGQARVWSRGDVFTVDFTGKAGLFGNAARQESAYATDVVTLASAGKSNLTSFVGELVLAGAYQATEHVALRAGYRALWVSSVALASDQLSASDFALGVGFQGSGDVFYHGAFAGLDVTW